MLLITGSSKGIGRATAHVAVEEGLEVMIHGRDEATLKALSKELASPYAVADVTDKKAVARAFGEVKNIHAWIHCCGEYRAEPFLDSTDETWLKLYQTNVIGFLHVAQVVIPHLVANGAGRIVHVISTRSLPHMANHRGAAYSASKAAALNVTIALAKELAPNNVLVNALSPGYTLTEIAKTWTDFQKKNASNVPLRRPAAAEETARTLLFLASKENSYMTGQHVVVDGGQTINC